MGRRLIWLVVGQVCLMFHEGDAACPTYCDPCAADPVFIQRDQRDVQTVIEAQKLQRVVKALSGGKAVDAGAANNPAANSDGQHQRLGR